MWLQREAFMVSVNHCFSLFFLFFPGELENAAAAALLLQQQQQQQQPLTSSADGKEVGAESSARAAEHIKKDGQYCH